MSLPREWLAPDWPAGLPVRAFVTTRGGGTSEGPFASLNLGASGRDDPARVADNRAIVRRHLPGEPRWLRQVHGAAVADLDALPPGAVPEADAGVTSTPGTVAVVLTADCLPVLFAREDGARVGAAHAGWRGLAAGVLEATAASMGNPSRTLAWLGPGIGPRAFEVGPEVREAFLAVDPRADGAFRPHGAGKYLADLYALARQRLARAGVTRVTGGGRCTFAEADAFFSCRRGRPFGHMGAFIAIDPGR